MARHAAEEGENMVDEEVMEVEDMRRKRREADPVVIPTNANVLPTTYHHLAGAYPVYQTSVYNPYLSYPIHQVQHKRRRAFSIENCSTLCPERPSYITCSDWSCPICFIFELAEIHTISSLNFFGNSTSFSLAR